MIVLDNCGGCGNAAYLPDEIQKGRFHGSQDSLKITSLIVEYLSILVLQTLKCFDFNSSEAMKLHLSDCGEESGSSVLSSAEIRCLVLVTEESQEGRADLLWAQCQNKSKVVS